MNQLGIALVWSAAQVTLVTLIAVGLYLIVSRRGPSAGSWVATLYLGVTIVLMLPAFCPLPDWWDWKAVPATTTASVGDVPTAPADSSHAPAVETIAPKETLTSSSPGDGPGGLTWPTSFLRRVWATMERAAVPSSDRYWRWSGIVAAVFLTGAGFWLLRLLLGLWAVHDCRQRSRPIEDASLLGQVEALRREMNCRCRVEIREAADVGTAATVGWRHPLLLLPKDWRTWSEAERRVVLAHELAHICRADYLAGLVARVSMVLHFYHPLVHWMAGRLHLQQELAADALGARYAGGRDFYLRALAQLALRQEKQSPRWPARAFLPARGTLLRRIQMLRVKEQAPKRPWTGKTRVGTVALLVGVALGASALRGPAQGEGPKAPTADRTNQPQVANETSRRANVPAFDLSYVPAEPDVVGVFGIRPAEFFRQPGMKQYAAAWNKHLAQTFQEIGLKPELVVPIEEIEQAVGILRLLYDEKKPKGQRGGLVMDVTMLRTVKDFDWVKHCKTNGTGVTEVKAAGRVYYNTPKPDMKRFSESPNAPPLFPLLIVLAGGRSFFVPDARTIVLGLKEETVRRMLEKGPDGCPSCVWAEGWKRVDHGVLAVALDNRGKHMSGNAEKSDDWQLNLFIQSNSQMVGGVASFDDFQLRAYAKGATEPDAENMIKWAQSGLSLGQQTLKQLNQEKLDNDIEQSVRHFANDFMRHAQVERQGTEVQFRSTTGMSFAKLLETQIRLVQREIGK
jgi:beta-lactamase regulating signal transducer with metallopeptidase domain